MLSVGPWPKEEPADRKQNLEGGREGVSGRHCLLGSGVSPCPEQPEALFSSQDRGRAALAGDRRAWREGGGLGPSPPLTPGQREAEGLDARSFP